MTETVKKLKPKRKQAKTAELRIWKYFTLYYTAGMHIIAPQT